MTKPQPTDATAVPPSRASEASAESGNALLASDAPFFALGSELEVFGVRLIRGDCRMACKLAPDLVGQVTLVVTSPPYHNAIDYDSHASDPTVNYRPRGDLSYANDYLPLLSDAWASCFEMLRPGGYLAINVGTVLLDGYQFPLPQDIMRDLSRSKEDWIFYRSIAWHKVTAGVRRAGTVLKYGLPGYWYPNIMTEHIIVVQKPGGVEVRPAPDVPAEWWEPVWDLAPVPPGKVDHPAPFPEDLPHRLIRMLTEEGDLVMDPFCGAGATVKAANGLNRRGIGFDLESKYLEYSLQRLRTSSDVRPKQLIVRPKLVSEIEIRRSNGQTRHGAGMTARKKRVGA